MKFIVCLFLCFLIGTAKADSWDNLTIKEAKKVSSFLKKNPYILDYCDCCGGNEVYLLKVISSEIVSNTWSEKDFSVKLNVVKVAQLESSSSGPSKYRAEAINTADSYTITMNYTFAYDKRMKWAVPLYKLVNYGYYSNHVCHGATNFPEPYNQNRKPIDADYKAWYDKHIEQSQP